MMKIFNPFFDIQIIFQLNTLNFHFFFLVFSLFRDISRKQRVLITLISFFLSIEKIFFFSWKEKINFFLFLNQMLTRIAKLVEVPTTKNYLEFFICSAHPIMSHVLCGSLLEKGCPLLFYKQ